MIKEKLYTEFLPYPQSDKKQIWIYVPEHSENDRLPVVYMTDGQNLFDENPTPYGSWGTVEAVKNEIKNGSGGAIIVGIDNGSTMRENELTPKSIGSLITEGENFVSELPKEMLSNLIELNKDFYSTFTAPEAEIFDDFLINTIIPYVESNFPVNSDKSARAVCGSSMGGLFAFYSGIENSGLFSFVGVFSPAFLLYKETTIINWLMSKMTDDMPYLYVYTGGGDMLEEIIRKTTESTYGMIAESGYPYDRSSIVIMPQNKHNENAWREIYPDFLHTFLSNCKPIIY